MSSPVKGREWEKTLTVKCRLCGGAKCKRCSESAALSKTDSPVHGLHADMVADRLLGMMRPSSRLMKEYQIASQFHKLGIVAVFNLTLPGEHPYCGDGLGASGFPYDPETDLMAEKIRFYNFGWEDMTTPTLSFMLDIAKVMASILQDGHNKVAVHCHAGYGRTGLAIACCLIFMHNIPPDRAIKVVRRDRPGSIQTSGQSKFVRLFHEFVNASRVVFALPLIHDRFSISEMVEQQNRLVHGEKCSGARLALPRALDFLCREVERAVEGHAVAVVHAFIFHLLWQCHDGRRSMCDLAEQYAKHGRAIFGESYHGETEATLATGVASSLPVGGGVIPPPPVPSSLAHSSHCVSQQDLFAVKVAFNVGEWNWNDAIALSHDLPAYPPALLLDWLEHLAEPLLAVELVALVAASLEESEVTKWKPLNQQPSCTIRSLDRVLVCLRHILRKAESLPPPQTGGSLSDALCVRLAMAFFHLPTTTPVTTLWKHADFVKELAREWQPPKRLELNLESLQKLTKTSSARKLHAQSPTAKHSHFQENELVFPTTPPTSVSPSRCSPEPVFLEPVVHPKSSGELSPLRQCNELIPPHSPPHPRPPPVELPPMAREKEERAAEPSPVKMESLVPRFIVNDTKKDAGSPVGSPAATSPIATQHHHRPCPAERDTTLIPTPPPPAGVCESPERSATLHASASSPSHPTVPPTVTRGSGSGSNVYSLPSVKAGDRYKNRLP